MKTILMVLVALGLTACATAKKKSSLQHLTGDWDGTTDYSKIADGLTRADAGGSSYAVEARPMTKAYIHAFEFNKGRKALDPDEKIRKAASGRTTLETVIKTCFALTTYTHSVDSNYLHYFRAKIKDASGNLTELTMPKKTEQGVAAINPESFGAFAYFRWVNLGVACTNKPVDISKPFTLLVTHESSDAAPVELGWDI